MTADHVVDIGPAAGIHGGHVVAEGTPSDIMNNPNSLTGRYLSGELSVAVPSERRKPKKGREIKVVGARANNLKNVTAAIPLGVFTAVTGVSGGGKSTFLIETLYKAAARRIMGASRKSGRTRSHRRLRAHRQGHRHRPVADRPHAALEPGNLYRRLHAHPRLVRRPAGGQGAWAMHRPLLVQRQGRPL